MTENALHHRLEPLFVELQLLGASRQPVKRLPLRHLTPVPDGCGGPAKDRRESDMIRSGCVVGDDPV
jgi:hypothetical protein